MTDRKTVLLYAVCATGRLMRVSWGVGKDYEVLVSKSVRTDQNFLGHILTLIDRPIFKPDKVIFWPNKTNLEWHRKKKFGRWV